MRTYTPRRASVTRWLESAPADVLDCFDDGPDTFDRFTIILGKRFMLEGTHGPRLAFLYSSVDPRGYSGSGEMAACDAATFRLRNGRKRVRWLDLPQAVRDMVTEWIK